MPHEGDALTVHARETFQVPQWAAVSEAAQALASMAARAAKGDPALAVLVRERQDLVDEWQKRDAALNSAVARDGSFSTMAGANAGGASEDGAEPFTASRKRPPAEQPLRTEAGAPTSETTAP